MQHVEELLGGMGGRNQVSIFSKDICTHSNKCLQSGTTECLHMTEKELSA